MFGKNSKIDESAMIEKTKDNEYLVRIPWSYSQTDRDGKDEYWRDTCAWAMERFGLPGHRFAAKLNEYAISFYFQHEQDAIVFLLRWS